ncbi:steroidogenic acute regulatory protein, mitochondrial [Aplochiton taeniatus]
MLPAVVKLCCGISYQHQRSMAGLKRTAVAAIGQEISQLQRSGQIKLPDWMGYIGSHTSQTYSEPKPEDSKPASFKKEELFYVQQGQENLKKALKIVEDKDGWKTEMIEENGEVIYSKMMPGARKVFRLETILKATPEELHNILFVKVAEMHLWNPSIQHVKILKQVGPETMITHER